MWSLKSFLVRTLVSQWLHEYWKSHSFQNRWRDSFSARNRFSAQKGHFTTRPLGEIIIRKYRGKKSSAPSAAFPLSSVPVLLQPCQVPLWVGEVAVWSAPCHLLLWVLGLLVSLKVGVARSRVIAHIALEGDVVLKIQKVANIKSCNSTGHPSGHQSNQSSSPNYMNEIFR